MAKRKNLLKERGRYVGVFPPAGGFHAGHKGVRRVLCRVADLEHLSKEDKAQRLHELWMKKSRELADAEFKANEEKKKKDNRKLWTVKDALKVFLDTRTDHRDRTIGAYKYSVNLYISSESNHIMSEFDNVHYAQFLKSMKNITHRRKPLAKNTINRHARHFRLFVNWCYEYEILHRLPKLVMPATQKKDMPTYDIKDLEKLRKHIEHKLVVATHSGNEDDIVRMKNALRVWWIATYLVMRLGAIWSLKLEMIDIDRAEITIVDNHELNWENKKKKCPIKPIGKKFLEFLKCDFAERGSKEKYYLDKGNGKPWYADPGNITNLFKKLSNECGLPDVKPLHHAFRATMITHLLNNDDTNLVEVQELADHDSINTTRTYLDSRRINQKIASDKLDELI